MVATGEARKRILGGHSLKAIGRAMRIKEKKMGMNPIEEGRADIVPWFLYDRQFAAASATTAVGYEYFTTPIGGTKYKQDTNMTQVGILANPQSFNCTSLRTYFSGQMTAVDINKFMDTYYLEFWVGDKEYAEGPLSMFPGGAGVNGVSTQTAVSSYSNGLPSPGAVFDFRMGNDPIGISILQGQNFNVKIKTNAGYALAAAPATGLSLMIVLEGILSRSVQ